MPPAPPSALPRVIGIQITRGSGDVNNIETRVYTYSLNQIDGGNDRA